MSTIYRSYIYGNNINDYGLADIFPNIGAVITASFLFISKAQYAEYKDELTAILGSVLGFIVYEFIQIKLPISIFDWKDIVGTIIGGIITFLIHKFLMIKFDLKDNSIKTNSDT
jgi:hypothetical protein